MPIDIYKIDWSSYKESMKYVKVDGLMLANVSPTIIDTKMILTALKHFDNEVSPFTPFAFLCRINYQVDDRTVLGILKGAGIRHDWGRLNSEQKELIHKLNKKDLSLAISRYPAIMEYITEGEHKHARSMSLNEKLADSVLCNTNFNIRVLKCFDKQVVKKTLADADKYFLLNRLTSPESASFLYPLLKDNMKFHPEIVERVLELAPEMINELPVQLRGEEQYIHMALDGNAIPNAIPKQFFDKTQNVIKLMSVTDVYDLLPEHLQKNPSIGYLHALRCNEFTPEASGLHDSLYGDYQFVTKLLRLEKEKNIPPEKSCFHNATFPMHKNLLAHILKDDPRNIVYINTDFISTSFVQSFDFLKEYAKNPEYLSLIPKAQREKISKILNSGHLLEMAKHEFSNFSQEFCELTKEIYKINVQESGKTQNEKDCENLLFDTFLKNKDHPSIEETLDDVGNKIRESQNKR